MIKTLKYVVFTGISLLLITIVLLLKPSTPFSKDKEILYLPTGKTSRVYLDSLVRTQQWLNTFWLYTWWANQQHLGQFLRPGKYEIPKGSSIFSFVWRLKKNRQVPVKLVIPKIRMLEQLAGFLGKHLENDSAHFLHFLKEEDSLKVFALDTSSVLTGIFPDTYEFYWTANSRQVFEKLFREKKKFWTPERLEEASRQLLTPDEVYILASIIEEETNAANEKDTLASIYLNRLRLGMPLQADPTIKYALRNFGLKRIYQKHLRVSSPYNTYQQPGLPPGPICTPSRVTLEAVLRAPKTRYLYFVANSNFSGTHVFSETYAEHQQKARAFQKAQDEQERLRLQKAAPSQHP